VETTETRVEMAINSNNPLQLAASTRSASAIKYLETLLKTELMEDIRSELVELQEEGK
jgi:hypothetical protein